MLWPESGTKVTPPCLGVRQAKPHLQGTRDSPGGKVWSGEIGRAGGVGACPGKQGGRAWG